MKFIPESERQSIPVWGLSVQNEPMTKQRWKSCGFTATEERDFLRDYLGHFSKFIRPGAGRIISASNRNHLSTTDYLKPDGKIAVGGMNDSDKNQQFQLWLRGQATTTTSQAHSSRTLVIS
ncbi:glycoside hydrolase family 30 beta sandwich domain-containing protein [Hymenobacter elongatus]|uniref:glycoside hydrolase family 30 beta sandwich domain-containing protein n=1 Tax=Hymenobacter elongatus TaxID=877208 RepID=UPI001AEBDC7D|nr:glycoside hydrolase family 30 beta sandwich domain-containing protein [Hymenobacter elongatus]